MGRISPAHGRGGDVQTHLPQTSRIGVSGRAATHDEQSYPHKFGEQKAMIVLATYTGRVSTRHCLLLLLLLHRSSADAQLGSSTAAAVLLRQSQAQRRHAANEQRTADVLFGFGVSYFNGRRRPCAEPVVVPAACRQEGGGGTVTGLRSMDVSMLSGYSAGADSDVQRSIASQYASALQ